jgi:hypothetical protein
MDLVTREMLKGVWLRGLSHAGLQKAKADALLCQLHTYRKEAPCMSSAPLATENFLDHLKTLAFYRGQIVHIECMASRPAQNTKPTTPLRPEVLSALASKGITPESLYSHQAAAVDALLQGRNVAICTSTASGKSLCYTIPILQVCSHNCQKARRALRRLCGKGCKERLHIFSFKDMSCISYTVSHMIDLS